MSDATKPRKRHSLSTRLWHWINAISVIILFMSGLNISNAHRYLYWGDWGFAPEQAWLAVPRFPGWATIPNFYSLSAARDWHVLFALVFGFSLLAFMIALSFVSFVWRATMRFAFTAREYGIAEGLIAVLRIPVANLIAILAGRRALFAYMRGLGGEQVSWDKTRHAVHPAGTAERAIAA